MKFAFFVFSDEQAFLWIVSYLLQINI